MFLVMLSVGAVSAVDDVNSTDNVFVDGTNDISCDLQNEYDDVEQTSNDYEIVDSSNYFSLLFCFFLFSISSSYFY